MKRWMATLLMLAAAVLVASCTGGIQPPSGVSSKESGFPLAITDDAQRTVTIAKEPKRIVSLSPSNTELVYALGLQDKLVGVDTYSDYPQEAKEKEKVGSLSKPSIEKIIELAPDLILATNIHLKTVIPELEKRELTVVMFQPSNVEGVLDNLRLLGEIGGGRSSADVVVGELQRRIEIVTGTTRRASYRPRVFFELSPDLISAGPDTFIDDLIAKAGGENIARDTQSAWPKLNPESIVLKDPEVIILSDHGSDAGGVTVEMVRERPGWNVIAGVKSGRIVPLPDRDIINRPGPRTVDGLDFLARTIQPELFK